MKTWKAVIGLLLAAVVVGGSVIVLRSPADSDPSTDRAEPIVIPPAELPDQMQCVEPSGQQKAALRFAVRGRDRELLDAPWALVRDRGTSYLAAPVDVPGVSVPLAVVVRFPDGNLSAMRAVNGTARTFTDLPEAGPRMPQAAVRALECAEP